MTEFVYESNFYFFSETSGVITSPNFPNNYDNNVKKEWLIKVPQGYYIEVGFLKFRLERHSSCK